MHKLTKNTPKHCTAQIKADFPQMVLFLSTVFAPIDEVQDKFKENCVKWVVDTESPFSSYEKNLQFLWYKHSVLL